MSYISDIGYRGGQTCPVIPKCNFKSPFLVKMARIRLLFMIKQKILALKVKKMPKFDKNWLFWDLARFFTKSLNFAQIYWILFSSGSLWSLPLSTLRQTSQGRAANCPDCFNSLHLPTSYQQTPTPALPKTGGAKGAKKKEKTLSYPTSYKPASNSF